MATIIKVLPNQSMSDVVVQATGSMSASMQFCSDNNLSASDVPITGAVYRISDAALALGNKKVLKYFEQNKVVIGNLGEQPPGLNFRILLKPVLQHVPNTADPPYMHGNMYDFDIVAAPGFINYYAIPNLGYPNPNCGLNYMPIDEYMAGGTVLTNLGVDASGTGPPYMIDKDVLYHLLWSSGHGDMFVWDAGIEGAITFTFRDVMGNVAFYSPFIVLEAARQSVKEYLIGDIVVDVVSSNSSHCTLRLTRSHAASIYPEYTNYNMMWMLDSGLGTPDPLDPTNPDKTIVTLPPGKYTFGITTMYTYLTYTWPLSKMIMIVEIY